MAVTIDVTNPTALLRAIIAKVDQQAVVGWMSDGESFTLTAPEWSSKAWLRPFPQTEQLVLGLVPSEGQEMSKELYAAYHGRLVEMLLTHFSDMMNAVEVTVGITYPDLMHWT